MEELRKELHKARLESLHTMVSLADKLMLELDAKAAREWISDHSVTLHEMWKDPWALNDYLDAASEWLEEHS